MKTVAPDDEARVAATLMYKHKFDRVPVVEGEAGRRASSPGTTS